MGKDFYNKMKIYYLIDNNTGKMFIDSTCKILSKRKAQLKYEYKLYLSGVKTKYQKVFEVIKSDNIDCILLEEVSVSGCEELNAIKRKYIDMYPDSINTKQTEQ